MKITINLLVLFFVQFMYAQKVIHKTIVNPENQFIQIDTNNCYKISLKTSKKRELNVEAEIEGEYQKAICLLYTSPSPRDQRGSRMPSSA